MKPFWIYTKTCRFIALTIEGARELVEGLGATRDAWISYDGKTFSMFE